MAERDHDGSLWKGVAAGALGGLAGSYAMNWVHELSARLSDDGSAEDPQHAADRGQAESARQGDGEEEKDDATVKAAARLSRGLFHHELDRREKAVAGPAVHYAFGTLTGGVYGALAELAPRWTAAGAGLPFGTAVWLAADEITVPALGLSGPPTESPLPVHARALAAHLVYGLTTDLVRRLVLRVL